MHIFISYAKQDTRQLTKQLAKQLTQLPDITVWWDQTLRPGDSWAAQIQDEIKRCDLFIVLLSPDVNRPRTGKNRGSFVLKEINYAQNIGKIILPIMAQATELPVQIADLQYIDLTHNQARGIAEIISEVRYMAGISEIEFEVDEYPTATRQVTYAPNQNNWFMVIALGLVLVAIVGGIIFITTNGNGNENSPTANPTNIALRQTFDNQVTQTRIVQITLDAVATQSAPAPALTSTATTTNEPDPATPTSSPTTSDTNPTNLVIEFFTADSLNIEATESVNLFWSVRGADDVNIYKLDSDRQQVQVWDVDLEGQLTVNPDAETTEYLLVAVQDELTLEENVIISVNCAYEWFFSPAPTDCPQPEIHFTDYTSQDFEHGKMIQMLPEEENNIFVFYTDGQSPQWEQFEDTYQWDDASTELVDDLVAPLFNFGKIWNENEQVRNRLGNATSAQLGTLGRVITIQQSNETIYISITHEPTLRLDLESASWSEIDVSFVSSEYSPGYLYGARIIANDDWTPVTREFDYDGHSVSMVLVPKGCFMMGSTDEQLDYARQVCELHGAAGLCDSDWTENEQPSHRICFNEPFWIDQFEVSNSQFEALDGSAKDSSINSEADFPREFISWDEAFAFCSENRAARLPSEAEWEYTARGPDNLNFPWGNEFMGSAFNFCDKNCDDVSANNEVDDGFATTAPIGTYDLGQSWVSAYDLSGNVFEWTKTLYADYPYDADDGRESSTPGLRVFRGGAWNYAAHIARAAARQRAIPDGKNDVIGFRCARDYDGELEQ